jgi:pilus assembly protein CpaE
MARRHGGAEIVEVDDSAPTPQSTKPAIHAGTKHPIVGVIGAKGGVGATTLAINLAAALAKEVPGATLIDANLQQPDAAVMMGKDVRFGLLDLLERLGDMDAGIVSACSVTISESRHCKLISPPVSGSAGMRAQAADIAQCLNDMRAFAPAWVIDLPKHLDKNLVMLMDRCDRIVVVLEPTLSSLSCTRRWQQIFAELGYAKDKVVYVLNRWGGKVKLVERQLDAIAPFADFWRVPNAFELSELSIARGEPAVSLNAKAPYSVTVQALAQFLLEETK